MEAEPIAADATFNPGKRVSKFKRPLPNIDMPIVLDKSYELSNYGTLKIKGFEINPRGFSKVTQSFPHKKSTADLFSNSTPNEAKGADHKSCENYELNPKDLIALGDVGRGACATVYKALHVPSLRMFAVKRVSVFDKSKRQQLSKELNALSSHTDVPEIIRLYNAFYDEGHVSMVLEYMNRLSLSDLMKRHGTLSEPVLRHISKQVLVGLFKLHSRHILHRDIKPANILIDSSGNAKLADFGILTALDSTADLAKSAVGTTLYLSPERVQGSYGAPADIWSFGMSILTLAVGRMPYNDSDGYFGIVRQITQLPSPQAPVKSSAEFKSFIDLCLVKDPAKRPSAAQLSQHPFITKQDTAFDQEAVMQVFLQPGEDDYVSLQQIVDLMIDHLYVSPSKPPTLKEYRQSLFELARFNKVAAELGIHPTHVQRMFEELYNRRLQDYSEASPMDFSH